MVIINRNCHFISRQGFQRARTFRIVLISWNFWCRNVIWHLWQLERGLWLKCCLSLLLSSSNNTNLIGKEGRKERGGKDKETDWWTKGQKNGQRRRRENGDRKRERREWHIVFLWNKQKQIYLSSEENFQRFGVDWRWCDTTGVLSVKQQSKNICCFKCSKVSQTNHRTCISACHCINPTPGQPPSVSWSCL